ncbi:hypothetical protein BX600DRAFT_434925 [Xylariales sp. PMI_506]|nr:hypothetical protein BX600DRAFT_434925 [Xylariales sp. PMI_506]
MDPVPAQGTAESQPAAKDAPPRPRPAPPARGRQVPPGYKVVKVRDTDGKIKTVLRPLSPEELAAQQASASSPAVSGSPVPPKTAQPAKANEIKPATTQVSPLPPKAVALVVADPTKNTAKGSPAVASTKENTGSTTMSSPAKTGVSNTVITKNSAVASEPSKADTTPAADGIDLNDALEQQRLQRRDRGKRRFKDSLLRGLVTVVGHTVPSISIGDIEHGDQVISDDDDDYSDDGYSDNDDAHDHHHHDDHHHHRDADDSPRTSGQHEHEHSHHHHHEGGIQINTSTALAAGAAALATSNGGPQPPAPAAAPAANGNAKAVPAKDKVTYQIAEKDLQAMEEKSVAGEAPLRRHWTDFSYYFMASLSIILPALFLVLGICIILMGGKSTTSKWQSMEEAIKVAISAWPIVYAAVIAQCLKTWATYRVERGIKLMELEQLVGSNSFGSAIKQPIVLRRIGLLSFIIFVLWCFSPLGSQALQHVYSSEYAIVMDTTTAHFVNMSGGNRVFSDANEINFGLFQPNQSSWDRLIQNMSIIYQVPFVTQGPYNAANGFNEDLWNHPVVIRPSLDDYVSNIGVPVFFDKSIFPNDGLTAGTVTGTLGNVKWEQFSFIMSTSMINFTCPATWSTMNGTQLEAYTWFTSSSGTLKATVIRDDNDVPNQFLLASLNDPQIWTGSAGNTTGVTSNCTMDHVMLDTNVTCLRTGDGVSTMPDCYTVPTGDSQKVSITSTDAVGTIAGSAVDSWVDAGTPWTGEYGQTTVTELFLQSGIISSEGYDKLTWKLSDSDTSSFTLRLARLFNTWVNLGYCPSCNPYRSWTDVLSSGRGDAALFTNQSKVEWWYTGDHVYTVDPIYVGIYFVCAGILLVAGIFSTVIDGLLVVPDVLGYASSAARNSRYLHLPKTSSKMSAPQRVREIGSTVVMMQDVKSNADIGRIALGNKHENATKLRAGRVYR